MDSVVCLVCRPCASQDEEVIWVYVATLERGVLEIYWNGICIMTRHRKKR